VGTLEESKTNGVGYGSGDILSRAGNFQHLDHAFIEEHRCPDWVPVISTICDPLPG